MIHALIAAHVEPSIARAFSEPLSEACKRFDIDRPARVAAFLGQLVVESSRFTRLEENLYYTTPSRLRLVFSAVNSDELAARMCRRPKELANLVYAKRNGNGDINSGDGWRYRGRGLIQLTGKGNYEDAQEGLGRPYVSQPELVALPQDACLTAAWYWHNHKLNLLADSWQIDAITRAVNGRAMLHADLRTQISQELSLALAG